MLLNPTEKKYEDIGIPTSYWDKEIEVKCPKCQHVALVQKKNENIRFSCLSCGKNEILEDTKEAYSGHGEMGQDPFFNYELYLKEETPYGVLWVYNADHLSHLKAYVRAKLREKKYEDKYFDYYQSYFHKLPAWVKSAKNRKIILSKILILEEKSTTKSKSKTPSEIAKEVDNSFFYRWNFKFKKSWKLLKDKETLEGNYSVTYYPIFNQNAFLVRNFIESTLVTSKRNINTIFVDKDEEVFPKLSLISTTKAYSYRHIKEDDVIEYISLKVRNLNNQNFTAKELLLDVAKIEIGSGILISDDMILFEKGDYIVQFSTSESSHVEFGFSESAMKKLMKLISFARTL